MKIIRPLATIPNIFLFFLFICTSKAQVTTTISAGPNWKDFRVAYIQYESIKKDAGAQNLLTYSNKQIFDVPGRNQSPYNMNDLFAVAPSKSNINGSKVQFIFQSLLCFTNTSKSITKIEFDAGDGNGYQTRPFDEPFIINYTTGGEKIFQYRITYSDMIIMNSHSIFSVNP